MPERRLAPIAVLTGIACCAGTAIAAVVFGGFALRSLGRFGMVSAATLIGVVAVSWLIDNRRAARTATDDRPLERHP